MCEKIDKKMLLEIFRIAAPSSSEGVISEYIQKKLTEFEVPFSVDTYGNIYNVSNKKRPILSSHMDTVQKEEDARLAKFIDIYTVENDIEVVKGLGNIGGDDKCGIYTILEVLKTTKDINFVFSKEEETGRKGISAFVKEINLKDKEITFGLVIDRRFATDIICSQNSYGTYLFQDHLVKTGKAFGYSPALGSVSDADTLKEYFSCANLSCGYYRPHSKQEYVKVPDLLKTVKFVESLIEEKTAAFPPTVKPIPIYGGNYKKDWRKDDFDPVTGYGSRDSYDYTSKGKAKAKDKERDKKTSASYLASLFPVECKCDACGTLTDCFLLSSFTTLTYVCSKCTSKIREELEDIELFTDPYYFNDDA